MQIIKEDGTFKDGDVGYFRTDEGICSGFGKIGARGRIKEARKELQGILIFVLRLRDAVGEK